jgi:hypothetical protein
MDHFTSDRSSVGATSTQASPSAPARAVPDDYVHRIGRTEYHWRQAGQVLTARCLKARLFHRVRL